MRCMGKIESVCAGEITVFSKLQVQQLQTVEMIDIPGTDGRVQIYVAPPVRE